MRTFRTDRVTQMNLLTEVKLVITQKKLRHRVLKNAVVCCQQKQEVNNHRYKLYEWFLWPYAEKMKLQNYLEDMTVYQSDLENFLRLLYLWRRFIGWSLFRGSTAVMRSIKKNLKRENFLDNLYYKPYYHETYLIRFIKVYAMKKDDVNQICLHVIMFLKDIGLSGYDI